MNVCKSPRASPLINCLLEQEWFSATMFQSSSPLREPAPLLPSIWLVISNPDQMTTMKMTKMTRMVRAPPIISDHNEAGLHDINEPLRSKHTLDEDMDEEMYKKLIAEGGGDDDDDCKHCVISIMLFAQLSVSSHRSRTSLTYPLHITSYTTNSRWWRRWEGSGTWRRRWRGRWGGGRSERRLHLGK